MIKLKTLLADNLQSPEDAERPSEMSLANLDVVDTASNYIRSHVDAQTPIDGWMEDAISVAKTKLQAVHNYLLSKHVDTDGKLKQRTEL